MINFTKEELHEIINWAMDKADEARRSKNLYINTFKYEQAKQIFNKVHDAYGEMLKAEGGTQ